MKKLFVHLLILAAPVSAHASQLVTKQSGAALAEHVRKIAVTNPQFRVIWNIDLDSLRCLGTSAVAVDGVTVGVCTVDGTLGWTNSDTVFGITVYQSDFESGKTRVSIKPLTGEI